MDPNNSNNNSSSGSNNPFSSQPASGSALPPTDPLSVTNPAPIPQPDPAVNPASASSPVDSSKSTLWPSSDPMAGFNSSTGLSPQPETSQWPGAASAAPAPTPGTNLNANPWLSPAPSTQGTIPTSSPDTNSAPAPAWPSSTTPPTTNPTNAFITVDSTPVAPDASQPIQQDPSQEAKQYSDPLTNSSQTANNWSASSTTPALSPLDNPMSSPSQTPGIGSTEKDTLSSQNWSSAPTPSAADQTPLSVDPITPQPQNAPTPVPDAPTDLSHLIGNTDTVASGAQPPQSAETMVIPQNSTGGDMSGIAPQNHKGGVPAWLIGLGVALLLLVAGASAFFILGVGKAPENTSVPATVTDTQNQIKPPAPVPTPTQVQPSAQPEATGSGTTSSFGQLQGSTPTQTPQASSAAEILKARQQSGQ